MPKRTVLTSDDNHELECYINQDGKAFLHIYEPGEDIAGHGHICLNKEDMTELIKILTDVKKQMS
jgi:hypothetical protein